MNNEGINRFKIGTRVRLKDTSNLHTLMYQDGVVFFCSDEGLITVKWSSGMYTAVNYKQLEVIE